MDELNSIFCIGSNPTVHDLSIARNIIFSHDIAISCRVDLTNVDCILRGENKPKAALVLKIDDHSWHDELVRILHSCIDSVDLRKSWAFCVDQIAQKNPSIIFTWESYLRSWMADDSSDQEYIIKLYRHMFNEFHQIVDEIFKKIGGTENERNRICWLRVLYILVRKTGQKKREAVQVFVNHLSDSNFEYLMPQIVILTRSSIGGEVLSKLTQKLPFQDDNYTLSILEALSKYFKNNDILLSLFSNSEMDFGILIEKLLCLSLSKSFSSVLASDILLILKSHEFMAFYMLDFTMVFDNHPLDLLDLIKESCDALGLPALKSKSICCLNYSLWKMSSVVSDQTSMVERFIQVLRTCPKARHVLLQSMLKSKDGTRFLYNHLESLTRIICELDLENFVKIFYFKRALSNFHPKIDEGYSKKSQILLNSVDLLPVINLWEMYVLAAISLKNGWWNIGTCFLQTLSSQKNLTSKTSEWLSFLKGMAEEEDALVSLKSVESDSESWIETLEFMVESELPQDLPSYNSQLLTARRSLVRICINLLRSYISEIQIEDMIIQIASNIRKLQSSTQGWADLGYHDIHQACDSFILILLGGRSLEQFETELDPCPEVISVIETLDFKVIEFLFSFTWRLSDKFFTSLNP